MPLNLLKNYNMLLDIDYLGEKDRNISLKMIFKRDFEENQNISFRGKKVNPTKGDGDAFEILFKHLTTYIVDKKTNERIFDSSRAKRLHWVKYHIDENKKSNMLVFSCLDANGVRTYILDIDEKYVIILQPYRDKKEYYLLTAYYLDGNNIGKIKRKYKRRLDDIL